MNGNPEHRRSDRGVQKSAALPSLTIQRFSVGQFRYIVSGLSLRGRSKIRCGKLRRKAGR